MERLCLNRNLEKVCIKLCFLVRKPILLEGEAVINENITILCSVCMSQINRV